MNPRWSVLAIGVVLAGCPGSTTKDVEEPAATDTTVAAKGARDLVKEIYGSLRRGSTGGLLPLLDPGMIAVGPGPADLFSDRSAALVALATAVPEGKHKLVSTDLRVMASPAGHAAWASDVVQLDGKSYVIGVIMLEADELWTVTSVQVGTPVPKKALAALLEKGPIPEPAAAPAPAGGGDKALADLFAAGAASPQALADQLAATPGIVVRDTGGKALVGQRAIKKAWKKSMKKVTTAVRKDTVRARLAPDGTLGWVFGTVDVTAGTDPPVPTRMLHVYEKTDDGWALVLASPAIAPAR